MANEIQTNAVEVQQAVDVALQEQKKKKKKKKLIIFGVILAVIIIIAAASSSGGSSNENNVDPIQNSTSDTTEDQGNQAIEAGNVLTTKNLKVTYISCNSDFKKYNEFLPPNSGNKIVRAEFNIENISSTDQYVSGFECYADNKKCDAYFGTDDATLSFDSISSGRATTLILYYEVPKNAKEIEIEFEDNIWSNEKTKFIIK